MLSLLKRVALTIVVIMALVKILPAILIPKTNLVAEVDYARVTLPPPAEVAKGQYPERIASIRVSNRGHLPCRDVTLRVPEAVAATVARRGQTASVEKHPQRMMLGDLGPRQSLLVTAWLSSAADTRLGDIVVSHKTGPGTVVVRETAAAP